MKIAIVFESDIQNDRRNSAKASAALALFSAIEAVVKKRHISIPNEWELTISASNYLDWGPGWCVSLDLEIVSRPFYRMGHSYRYKVPAGYEDPYFTNDDVTVTPNEIFEEIFARAVLPNR